MLTAKLVRLEITWSAMPQPRRRAALPFSRWTAAIHDRRSLGAVVPSVCGSDSAAMHHATRPAGRARQAPGGNEHGVGESLIARPNTLIVTPMYGNRVRRAA